MAKQTEHPKPQTKTQQKPNAPVATNGSVDSILDKHVEYTPFLAKETIKLSPRTVIGWLAKPTKSGQVCTPQQALRFVMLCKARGLNPWEGDAYLVGYDAKDGPEFNLITAHQAFLKRAEVHPEFDGMESGVVVRRGSEVIDEQGDFLLPGDVLLGGWARVHFKQRKHAMYRRLNLSAFVKPYGVWQHNPGGMIVKCAEADALRSAFPNSLGGMYLDAELGDPASAPIVQQRAPVPMPTAIDDKISDAPPIVVVQPDAEPEAAVSNPEATEEMDESGPIPPARQQTFADAGSDPARM